MKEFTETELIERSIYKKFRKELWAPFITAVKAYDLITEGDRIAVCISGGKDSMLAAKMMQILQRHSEVPFELVFLMMDPGYKPEIRQQTADNAERLGIPLTIFETNIFAVAERQEKNACYLCARMRRGHLYNTAKELSCNKIALGHHLNDVIETTLMAMFYASKLETIVPKAVSENFSGMELIRPLYRVREENIVRWAQYNHLEFIRCACRFTEKTASEEMGSKRLETKELIRSLREVNPDIEENIFRSLHSVHLKTFPGFVDSSGRHSFLEIYPEEITVAPKKD